MTGISGFTNTSPVVWGKGLKHRGGSPGFSAPWLVEVEVSCLAGVGQLLSKAFCPVSLPLSSFFVFWLSGCFLKNCTRWCFQVASFSNTQSRLCEAKRKPRKFTTCHFYGPEVPSPSTFLHFSESSSVCFIYSIQGFGSIQQKNFRVHLSHLVSSTIFEQSIFFLTYIVSSCHISSFYTYMGVLKYIQDLF